MNAVQSFNGKRFSLDNQTGYYKCGTTYMHRYVWEFYNGPIPDGYEIHHKDFNRANNDITNLECLSKTEHKKLHGELLRDEQRELMRNNLKAKARPKAIEWHKSDEGKDWHTKHIKQQWESGSFKKELVCTNCGKTYIGGKHGETTFCSNACKSAYRRKIGVDLVPAICVYCGHYFKTNKNRPSKTCSRSCANRYRAKVRRGN